MNIVKSYWQKLTNSIVKNSKLHMDLESDYEYCSTRLHIESNSATIYRNELRSLIMAFENLVYVYPEVVNCKPFIIQLHDAKARLRGNKA